MSLTIEWIIPILESTTGPAWRDVCKVVGVPHFISEAELLPRSNRPPQLDDESTQIVNPKELALAAPPRRSEPPAKQTLGRPRLFQPSISEEEMTNLLPGKSLSERAAQQKSSLPPPASPSRRGSFPPVAAEPARATKEDSLLASLSITDDEDDDLMTEVRAPIGAPSSARPAPMPTFARSAPSLTHDARPSSSRPSRISERPRPAIRSSAPPSAVSVPAHFALGASASGQFGQITDASDSRLDLQGVAGTLSVPAAAPRRSSWGSAFAIAGAFVAVVGVAMAGTGHKSFHALSSFIDPSAKASVHTSSPVVAPAPVAAAAQVAPPVAAEPVPAQVPAVVLPAPAAAPVAVVQEQPEVKAVAVEEVKPAAPKAKPTYSFAAPKAAPAPKPVAVEAPKMIAEAPKPKAVARPVEEVKPAKKPAKKDDDGSMKAAAEALSKAQLENSL